MSRCQSPFQGVWISSAQMPCRLAGSPPGRELLMSKYRPKLKYSDARAGSSCALRKPDQSLDGRQLAVGGRRQVQLHAVEVFLMIRRLCRAKFNEGFLRRLVEVALSRGHWIAQLPSRKTLEVRRGGQKKNDLIRLLHHERLEIGFHGTTTHDRSQPRGVAHASAASTVVERPGHQQFVVRRGRGLETLRSIQRDGKRQRARLVRGQTRDEHFIRRGHEMLARESYSVFLVDDLRQGCTKIERPRILVRRSLCECLGAATPSS